MKILALYDHSGPKLHRILLPVDQLQKKHNVEVKVTYSPNEEDLEGVDILFFNRVIPGVNGEDLLRWREKYGFKMVCDLDDAWILDKNHILYDGYKHHQISEVIEWFIRASDLITVTHDRLLNEVLPLNKNVQIFPNAIPKIDQFLVKKIPDELTRLFWAGGITHRRDLELLREPLKKIKRDKCKLIMGGYVKGEPEWREMAKIFTTNSSYNTQVIESLPVNNYYHTYSLCDVSLVPLVDVSFNRYKSNLKILEAANIEAPVIVSRVHPYLDFPDHLVNYVDLNHTWYTQINKLLRDPILRKEQGIELRNYCDVHYNFSVINAERNQVFNYLLQAERV